METAAAEFWTRSGDIPARAVLQILDFDLVEGCSEAAQSRSCRHSQIPIIANGLGEVPGVAFGAQAEHAAFAGSQHKRCWQPHSARRTAFDHRI